MGLPKLKKNELTAEEYLAFERNSDSRIECELYLTETFERVELLPD